MRASPQTATRVAAARRLREARKSRNEEQAELAEDPCRPTCAGVPL